MDTVTKSDELVMKLLHYFITEQGYNPVILHGAKDEIWLENLNNDYKIIRIVTNYIHNDEQFDFDMYKTKQIARKIGLKTFSFNMNTLSFFLNLGENVKLNNNVKMEAVGLKELKDIKNYKSVLNAFPDITKETDYKENGMNLFIKLTTEINKKNEQESEKAENIFKLKTPYVTISLIIINVVVFALMYILGNGSTSQSTLIKFGAYDKSLVLSGEYYRLITSSFIHIGLLHLIFNCYALYIIGRQMESFLGKIKYIIVYFVSALCGSLLTMVFPISISAGASGAIFGLLGSMLYFGYNYRVYLGNVLKSQIIPLIALNLLIGFMSSSINNAAHIGGLVGGILITYSLGLKYKSSKSQKINGWILLIIFVSFLTYLGFFYK